MMMIFISGDSEAVLSRRVWGNEKAVNDGVNENTKFVNTNETIIRSTFSYNSNGRKTSAGRV